MCVSVRERVCVCVCVCVRACVRACLIDLMFRAIFVVTLLLVRVLTCCDVVFGFVSAV